MADTKSRFILTAVDRTSRVFGSVERRIGGVEGAASRLTRTFGLLGVALGGASIVNTLREFGSLRAQLETATGSIGAATQKFSELQQISQRIPFSLQETTETFVRLTNLGIEPNEKALISYANTASATGKSVIQFGEAIADAITGEFERLKEFGIRASKEGERVSFTFRGVAREIGFNANEIQGFLQEIGDTAFAGAAARRANSLDGALSNLGDTASILIDDLGEAGLTKVIKGLAQALSIAGQAASKTVLALGGVAQLESLETATDKQLIARLASLREEIKSLDNVVKGTNQGQGFNPSRFLNTDQLSAARQNLTALRKEFNAIEDFRRNRNAAASLVAPTGDTGEVGGQSSAESSRRSNNIQRIQEKLKGQLDALQLTEKQLLRNRLAELGATEATIARAEALQDQVDTLEALGQAQQAAQRQAVALSEAEAQQAQALKAFADELTEAVNPAIAFEREIAKIQEVFEKGLISEETLSGASIQAIERFKSNFESVNEELDKGRTFADRFGETIADNFENAIVKGSRLKNIINSLGQDILAITTRQLVTAPLGNLLSNQLSGLSGAAGGFFSGLFGAANGVDFTVGGSGGTDSQPVSFLATPGERVRVETQRQQQSGRSTIINNSFPSVRDFTQFQRSEREFNAAILASVGRF